MVQKHEIFGWKKEEKKEHKSFVWALGLINRSGPVHFGLSLFISIDSSIPVHGFLLQVSSFKRTNQRKNSTNFSLYFNYYGLTEVGWVKQSL